MKDTLFFRRKLLEFFSKNTQCYQNIFRDPGLINSWAGYSVTNTERALAQKAFQSLIDDGLIFDTNGDRWYHITDEGKLILQMETDLEIGSDDGIAKPLVFISYDTDELPLADFLKNLLNKWLSERYKVFVAKRDIHPGDNPLKVMMEEALKNARAIFPICSSKSKTSPWLWWESGSVWARDKKVYPLFTNISPNDFGAPLILVAQGKSYFDKSELLEILRKASVELGVKNPPDTLSFEDGKELERLTALYSKADNKKNLQMSEEAKKILLASVDAPRGQMMHRSVGIKPFISINDKEFIQSKNPRTIALWESALNELKDGLFIEKSSFSDVYQATLYKVTKKGYDLADSIKNTS